MNKKIKIDKISHLIFLLLGILSASTIVLIIFFIVVKGLKPFVFHYQGEKNVNFFKFLVSTTYYAKSYGVMGLVINTIFVTFLSLLIAMPISIFSALFIVRTKIQALGKILKAMVEMLSAIPSVIYGLFGMGVINPFVRNLAWAFNLQSAGGASVLSTVIVLAMMIIPTITLLSLTAMEAVPNKLVLASYALGASNEQTNYNIIIRGAKRGIIAGGIIGVGRALGEATAVSMVSGGSTKISIGLFNTTETLTSAMLSGIYESSGINYDIRFSVGLVLIVLILISNVLLNLVKRKLCKYDA